jgi:hypothetical protein
MDDETFRTEWAALTGAERRRIRRLARIGRIEPGSPEERLAGKMAQHQISRPWWRFFWFWFVPGLVMALGIATQIHPIAIGVVLAFAAQALVTRRNVSRLAART